MDFLGSEAWEAGDAKVPFKSFRIPYCTLWWHEYKSCVGGLGGVFIVSSRSEAWEAGMLRYRAKHFVARHAKSLRLGKLIGRG